MYDPIGGFLRIRELYLTYLETAFRIGDPLVSAERRELLERAGTLCTDPLLEPLPRYRTVDWKLRDLPVLERGPLEGFGKDDRETFVRLVSAGLFENDGVNLYRHQAEMLQRGSNVGQPGIVTSGTGSGKTESFLLPVLATISREARGWTKPAARFLQEAWWHDANGRAFESFSAMPQERRPLKKNPDADPFVPHRDGENRTAAVRCLILYPMNALVEDQLARLRKALDSERVRSEMDEHISGNRIFFGRYTSDTPVTGFNIHPRTPAIDDYKRRGRQLKKLFEEMVQYERAQRKVNEQAEDAESEFSDDDRYLFPSVNGSELLSRWDMQTYPPDILITNVSMLGAMLNREVDAPIFDATRDWLASNNDAYFFLVLDELHLQRGAAGTEVAYLLRLLLQRLGLTDPAHRHKLRILASSASLPTEGAEGMRSQTYLWDMFGSLGTWTPAGGGAKESDIWRDAIVTGETEPEQPRSTHQLPTEAFQAFVRRYGGTRSDPACTGEIRVHEREWRQVAKALKVPSDGAMPELVRGSIEEAGRRLAAACWSDDDRRARATGVVALSSALFGASDQEAREALRGLLLARGLGDAYSAWFPDEAKAEPLAAPSFRLHTFFRSIEGLYAPLDRGEGVDEAFRSAARMVGTLSLERAISEESEGRSEEEKELPLRLFELLYCECCGELFVGGMRRKRATNEFELLPNEAELDGLPDSAASQRFEDLSYDQYCVFWPTERQTQPLVADTSAQTPEGWAPAGLDPATGVVRTVGPSGQLPEGQVRGWLFRRGERQDRHRRGNQQRGTNVPYQCPSCETDYPSARRKCARRALMISRPAIACSGSADAFGPS